MQVDVNRNCFTIEFIPLKSHDGWKVFENLPIGKKNYYFKFLTQVQLRSYETAAEHIYEGK